MSNREFTSRSSAVESSTFTYHDEARPTTPYNFKFAKKCPYYEIMKI